MVSIETNSTITTREETFPNGDTYTLHFSSSVPHESGKYIWADGAVYEGDWDQNKITGKGRVVWRSGASYEGEVCGGFLEGSGTFKGTDGSIYDGCWKLSKYYGMGTKVYESGDSYEGFWKEGLQEGLGKYSWTNGNTYLGNWKAGKMSGKGVLKWSNGDIYNGFWKDGLMHGTGYYRYAEDGTAYVGTWSKGLKDGHGVIYQAGSQLPSENPLFNELFGYNVKNDSNDGTSIKGFFCSKKMTELFLNLARFLRRNKSPRISNNVSQELNSNNDNNSDKLVCEREYMQGVLIMERASTREEMERRGGRERGRKPWETIYMGHKSYYLMLNLQLGIRYTVGKITPVPLREVRSSDFGPRARIRMYFPREGTQFTPPHHSINFAWKDYCPMVFRNLREMFRIDAADYMMSICGGDGLKELSSPGKSGSIFYLSQDERFVIKTLTKTELKVLLKMLPRYYVHVGAYENTLITKFFGLHRIKLKSGRKVRFVVMGNMFCTELRIHKRYDLKGSTQGRFTKKQNSNEKTTLKDLDLNYVFYIEKSWRESLFKQISVDCMFLESQKIIDYSILLGIHFRAPTHLKSLSDHEIEQTANPSTSNCSERMQIVAHEPGASAPGSHIRGSMVRASQFGLEEVDLLLPGTARLRVQLGVNMPARACIKDQNKKSESSEDDPFEVYDVVLYLGIIDILQEYNLKKKAEHALKSLKFDPSSISAVEPRFYAQRFISFLEKVFQEKE
ncbi:hypothetical protein LUZ60_006325 [Juncus effusus]|nr:hypothetical protein LUZ60_006325 [Juncus effusus]